MSMREHFPPAAAAVAALVVRATSPDLDGPTPCHDYDLRALVNHIVGTTAAMARAGRHQPLDPDDPYGSTGDAASGDWRTELAGNVERVAEAWSRPEAWEGVVDLGGSVMPAPMIGEMAVAEVLLHGWDVARATGQDLLVDDELGREVLRSVEETAELGRSMRAYGDAQAAGPDATPFQRALAASGRDPGWSAG